MTRNKMRPVSPGEVLREQLEELGMSANALATALHVPANRVTGILNATRALTPDTALRLERFFRNDGAVLAESAERVRSQAGGDRGKQGHPEDPPVQGDGRAGPPRAGARRLRLGRSRTARARASVKARHSGVVPRPGARRSRRRQVQPYQASREKPDSRRLHATLKVSLPEELSSDDELDAVVGLINLLDLASGHGDIFGAIPDERVNRRRRFTIWLRRRHGANPHRCSSNPC